MVMDLLGPDMEHLLEFMKKRTFSAKTCEYFRIVCMKVQKTPIVSEGCAAVLCHGEP